MHRLTFFVCLVTVVSTTSSVAAEDDNLRRTLKRLRMASAKQAANDFLTAQKELAGKYSEQEAMLRYKLNSQLESAAQEATSSKNYTELQRILDARETLQNPAGISTSTTGNSDLRTKIKSLEREVADLKRSLAKTKGKRKIPRGAIQFGGKTYFVFEQEATWHHADYLCRSVGGYVARIESQAEHDFLKSVLNSPNFTAEYYWIDGSDAVEEGTWVLSNGVPMLYEGWSGTEPGNVRGIEHHVCLVRDSGWKWSDYCGADRKPFICEWDPK